MPFVVANFLLVDGQNIIVLHWTWDSSTQTTFNR